MPIAHQNHALSFCCAIGLACATAGAHADSGENTIKIGVARIAFNTKTGDLAGPPGTTPPGVQADLNDANTLALIYERKLAGPWSVVLQMGTPPVVRIVGACSAAALGPKVSAFNFPSPFSG